MSSKAKTLARRLLRENRRNGRSWRVIAREDYAGAIPAGTLCRIAKEGGAWTPKDDAALIALGLKTQRKSKSSAPRDLYDMATDTLRDALINRVEMPPVDKRIIREFQKLGWIKRTRK